MSSAETAAALAAEARDEAAEALAALGEAAEAYARRRGGGRDEAPVWRETAETRDALGVAVARYSDAIRGARLVATAEADGRGAYEDAVRRRDDEAERLAETAAQAQACADALAWRGGVAAAAEAARRAARRGREAAQILAHDGGLAVAETEGEQ